MARGVEQERAKFSRWLRLRGIRFVITHRASELEGAPSHLIIDRPPLHPDALGVVVLFKHADRLPKDSQSEWLDAAAAQGWKTVIAFCFADAVTETLGLGYMSGHQAGSERN